MKVSIRPLLFNDIPQLAKLILATPLWQRYGLTEAGISKDFERALKRSDLVLVAESKKQGICCFAWAQAGASFGRSGYLKLIGVEEGIRGQGIGKELLKEVEDFIKDVSYDLFLLVSDFNKEAQAFYIAQGYEQVGSIPAYILPDVSELIFRKRFAHD